MAENTEHKCECGGGCGDDCRCHEPSVNGCPARILERRGFPQDNGSNLVSRMTREHDPRGNIGIGDVPSTEDKYGIPGAKGKRIDSYL